ncbi:MAG: PAS domain S-box protein [Deltaproteobacteria bacterium]|nr:PAS domain S-box protein [Deltaproteobacteria bacterium]
MKITIRTKLMVGYIAVLILMLIVSIFAYITLVSVSRSVNQILVYAHKYDMVDSLRQSTRQFVEVSDSLIRGQIQNIGYYQSIARDVEKKISYVEKLRLKDNEKDFLKRIDTEFNSVQRLTEQSLKWTAQLRNVNFADVLREIDKAKPILLSSADGLYDEAWRSLDTVTILADKDMERGIWQIVIFSLIAIIAGVGISIYISQRIITPIRALSAAAGGVAKGDLNQTVQRVSGDEIGELVASFNQMVVELKTSRERVEKYNKELKTMVEERTSELERTKEYLENILEHSGDMIVTATLFDEIAQFNKEAETILGYSKETIVGSKIEYLFVDKNEYKRIRKKVIEDGEIYGYETKLMKKNGDVVYVNLILSRLKDKNGNTIGLIGIGRDITGSKPC